MRLKTIIYILFLAISLQTYSQSIVFNEIYDIDSLNNSFKPHIELNNGDFICASQASVAFGTHYIYLTRIDVFGNEIWKKKIDIEIGGVEVIGDIIQVYNSIYFLGLAQDTSLGGIFNSFLYKTNLDGDSLYFKRVFDTLETRAGKIIFKDNHFYTLDWFTPDNSIITDIDITISKLDTLGNVISEWIYGYPLSDGAVDFKATSDGGFIIAGQTNSLSTDNNFDFWFLKIDNFGNEQWSKTYGTLNDETIRTSNYLEITKDWGYVMVGEEDLPAGSSYNVQSVIFKVNFVGDSLWRKTLNLAYSTYVMNIREWNDGTLIVCGDTYDNNNPNPVYNSSKGYLLKMTADGENIIWQRTFSKDWSQVNDYHRGLIITSDGGILSSGWTGGIGNDAWLVKFDSCGYTVGDVPEPMLIIDSIKGKTVYMTDQSTNYCTAEIDWGDGTETQPYYAYENNQPLAPKHFSHTYNQIDDYTITTTALAGEEFRDYSVQVLGLSNHSIGTVIPAQAGISLFPNPANDFVIIQNPYSSFVIPTTSTVIPATSTVIPAQAGISNTEGDSFLQRNDGSFKMTIHGLNGKQVKSINLNPKLYQQKIDVTVLNNGVYFVRFEMDGELVGTEKLVIAR